MGVCNASPHVYSSPTALSYYVSKDSASYLSIYLYGRNNLTTDTKYYARLEVTFLLSENLAS